MPFETEKQLEEINNGVLFILNSGGSIGTLEEQQDQARELK